MIRLAACLRVGDKCTAPISARVAVRNQSHAHQRCFHTSIPTLIRTASLIEIPSKNPRRSLPFSSFSRMQVNVSENDGKDQPSYMDAAAAAHSEVKALKLKDGRREKLEIRAKTELRRREVRRRTVYAQELMRIFAAHDECFNITLRELNINKTWGSDSGLSEYRNFYLDSLNSFGTMIAEDHGDGNDLAEVGLSSASAVGILEQFASISGHSDDTWASSRNYMKMINLFEKEQEHMVALERLRKDHQQRLRELEVEEPLLELLESEQTRERDARVTKLGRKLSSTKELLPLIQNLEEDDDYSDELAKLERELKKALSQVANLSESKAVCEDLLKQRGKVNNIKALVETLAKRINTNESEIGEIIWPMTPDEYQSTTENIEKIALSVAPALAKFISHRHDDFDKYKQLEMHTDLTSPHEWYPHARLDKRKVIFHAGPTNSGKTYSALQRLKKAEKGMYLAPLRLLAAETYENLTAEGIYTNLLTGQEKRNVPFSTHRSSTVELACLEEDYDVVVIDEIQMLSDGFRGFAWTRALLGVRCKEVHVCGGTEAVDIVKKICNMCGDDFELHKYERFSELKVQSDSLAKSPTAKGSYKNVQPGDCVVAFSRQDIFAIKREIEHATPYKCCVIYGSLPPDVRAEQARRFNDPNSEYDILVASDAIGMGLNLSIKRIIFNSLFKHNGVKTIQLDHSSVKQIAGRAGRRNSPYPHGEVTCRDPNDMAHLRKCMGTEIQPLDKAGLIPTPNHIAVFYQHLVDYGSSEREMELHRTLSKFSEMATLKGIFFLCRKQSMETVSLLLKDVDNMSIVDKFTLCMSPVKENCPKSKNVLLRYIEKYSSGKAPGIHYSMRPKPAQSFDHLADLCSVHHQLELFLWLQSKLPSNAVEVLRATTMKDRATDMINNGLFNAEKLSIQHDYVSTDMRRKRKWADESKDD